MITLQNLKEFSPETVFASGENLDSSYFGYPFKWVAIRGGIHDWAVYHGPINKSFSWIADTGDKVHPSIAKILVNPDLEALQMYRI